MGASYERLRRRDSYREQGGGHVPEEVEDSSASRGAENLPNSDGVQFALGALVYDMYLFKRVYSTVPPSPFEVMVLALGVAVSLAGLAWWNTPGGRHSHNAQQELSGICAALPGRPWSFQHVHRLLKHGASRMHACGNCPDTISPCGGV